MYIMCVILCLFSTLSRRVGALQISIITIIIRRTSRWKTHTAYIFFTNSLVPFSFLYKFWCPLISFSLFFFSSLDWEPFCLDFSYLSNSQPTDNSPDDTNHLGQKSLDAHHPGYLDPVEVTLDLGNAAAGSTRLYKTKTQLWKWLALHVAWSLGFFKKKKFFTFFISISNILLLIMAKRHLFFLSPSNLKCSPI